MTREAAVVAAAQRLLTKRGAWWVNVHGSGTGRNGIPDILFCHRGRFGAVECKSPTGKPTRLQLHELGRIARAGGVAIVAKTTEELEQILDAIDRENPAP